LAWETAQSYSLGQLHSSMLIHLNWLPSVTQIQEGLNYAG
jgi:hypothetical protein